MSGPQPSLRGDVLVLLSMFAAVAMMLCSKRLVERYDALHVTATTIALGTILLFIWVELSQPLRFHFSWKTWTAVLAQGYWRQLAHTSAGIGVWPIFPHRAPVYF